MQKDMFLALVVVRILLLLGDLAQLAVEELRKEGHDAKFIAVRLPYGVQQDEDDARNFFRFYSS